MRVPGECGGSDVFQRLARAVWSRYHRGGIRRSGDCVSFRLGVRDEYGVSGFLMSRIEARFTKLANMFQKSVPKNVAWLFQDSFSSHRMARDYVTNIREANRRRVSGARPQ
jgi:hypothetical protein